VRLYSNLHQDLFNKEHKQKEEREMIGGGGLTFCKNCKITIRIFRTKKSEKRQKQGVAMFGTAAPILPYTWVTRP
jgi:hypothetical protein